MPMKLTLDIITSILLLFWPALIMLSPMMFDAPGSENNKSNMLFLIGVIVYPLVIFAAYKLFGASYFSLSANLVLAVVLAVTIAVCLLFDYPRFILNAFRDISNSGYFVSETAVYHNGLRIKQALPGSFKQLGGRHARYAKDASHVFYGRNPLAGADPDSFVPLTPYNGQTDDAHSSLFWKDKHHVYADGVALKDAQPGTFKPLGGRYGHDGTRVYYAEKTLEKANPGKFVLLSPSIGKDDSNLYVFDKRISQNVDIATFSLIDLEGGKNDYAKDRARVYVIVYGEKDPVVEIDGADPATFVLLEREYSKDKHSVYYKDSALNKAVKLEGVDPATFEVTGYDNATESDANDRGRYYLSGKLLER
jgi:hypothetical protein